jgi:DNA-binding PadR family transcriptional regulator
VQLQSRTAHSLDPRLHFGYIHYENMPNASLKPAAFQILVALLEGESHGYALLQSAREQSPSKAPLSTASFYRHLHKLVDGRLVEVVARPDGDDPRRGDYYKLTAAGRELLLEEKMRLTMMLSALDGVQPTRRTRS